MEIYWNIMEQNAVNGSDANKFNKSSTQCSPDANRSVLTLFRRPSDQGHVVAQLRTDQDLQQYLSKDTDGG
jgi:hypothetical protein